MKKLTDFAKTAIKNVILPLTVTCLVFSGCENENIDQKQPKEKTSIDTAFYTGKVRSKIDDKIMQIYEISNDSNSIYFGFFSGVSNERDTLHDDILKIDERVKIKYPSEIKMIMQEKSISPVYSYEILGKK